MIGAAVVLAALRLASADNAPPDRFAAGRGHHSALSLRRP
jgi:hypothetical protein